MMKKSLFLRLSTILKALIILLMLSCSVYAHSPLLLIEDNEDGTILVTAGFSNGQLAAGKPLQLKSQASGKVLWEGKLDQQGELTCPKQSEPYTVFFDGGAGHRIEKAGPQLQAGETVSETLPHKKPTGNDAAEKPADAVTSASRKKTGGYITPPHAKDYMPLSPDFDERMTHLLPASPLMIQDSNGVIRAIPIVQGYQYHHQSGFSKIKALIEKKKQAGKKVEVSIKPVGLCFGVTTGYLALEYAIQQLYGNDIPLVDDFTITTKTTMGGVWDLWDLYFGTSLSREDAEFGIAPKAYIFTAERPSSGQKIVFTYSSEFAADIKHLGEAKKHPEKFQDQEFHKAKKILLTELLEHRAKKDMSIFDIIEQNF